MAYQTIPIDLNYDDSISIELRRISNTFNAGVQDRAYDGLNTALITKSINTPIVGFNNKNTLDTFLRNHRGNIPFYVPAGLEAGIHTNELFVCSEWGFDQQSIDVWSFKAELKKVYRLATL